MLDNVEHFYCLGDTLVETRNGSNQVIQQHVWHSLARDYIDSLAEVSNNTNPGVDDVCDQRLFTLQDVQFNILALTDDAGDVVERYEYTLYGERTVMNASFATLGKSAYNLNNGFQGLYHDVETGLIYNRARMLNSRLGRFNQRDPLGYPDGMNTYAAYHVLYGGVDPWGMFLEELRHRAEAGLAIVGSYYAGAAQGVLDTADALKDGAVELVLDAVELTEQDIGAKQDAITICTGGSLSAPTTPASDYLREKANKYLKDWAEDAIVDSSAYNRPLTKGFGGFGASVLIGNKVDAARKGVGAVDNLVDAASDATKAARKLADECPKRTYDGFSDEQQKMIEKALAELAEQGVDTSPLKHLAKADGAPPGYRAMTLDDGAALMDEAFESPQHLKAALEEEALHHILGKPTTFGPSTVAGEEAAVDAARQVPHPR